MLGVNNQLAGDFFSSSSLHVRGATRTGSLLSSLTFLLLHKNVSPG